MFRVSAPSAHAVLQGQVEDFGRLDILDRYVVGLAVPVNLHAEQFQGTDMYHSAAVGRVRRRAEGTAAAVDNRGLAVQRQHDGVAATLDGDLFRIAVIAQRAAGCFQDRAQREHGVAL